VGVTDTRIKLAEKKGRRRERRRKREGKKKRESGGTPAVETKRCGRGERKGGRGE